MRPLVVLFALMAAPAALAQTTTTTRPADAPPADMIHAEAPEAMVAAMQDLGYRAALTTDDQGDPKIKSAAGGANFSVYFYGCTAGKDCNSIQFSAGFDMKEAPSSDVVNDWNRHNRYGQVSLDSENDPYIEMDIAMKGGLPRDLFETNLSIWDNMLADFQRHIDW